MSRVLKLDGSETLRVFIKGAPEAIMDLCKLKPADQTIHLKALQEMAEAGYRVLGLASTDWPDAYLPETQEGFSPDFIGLIALEDPIRPDVPQAITECHEAGVKVVMITGDYPLTAMSIATQIGLKSKGGVMTGAEMDDLSDKQLRERIASISVFARVVPEQKLRIVRAFKANKEVVAMTGDGVNDAPALKAAHIGIAMGMKGTDVARESAALVLLDDQFASIVSAIRLGRRIYDNLQKAMSYILAIHIPIIGLALLPAFFLELPLLLFPLHIIFMELIIDPVCSLAFESEQEERNIMQRPPRKTDEAFFGFKKMRSSLLQGLMLLGMVMAVYFYNIDQGHSAEETRAISFSALILGNIGLILTSLSRTRFVFSVLMERNVSLIIILSSALILLLAILFIPPLQSIFAFANPGLRHFIPALTGAFTVITLPELYKFARLNRKPKP